MRFGFYLPTRGPTATRKGVPALAREGERLGMHFAMFADHIVFPVESQSIYPHTVDRKGSPDFDSRGAVTDEWIVIFKQLWSELPASFSGLHYKYADIRADASVGFSRAHARWRDRPITPPWSCSLRERPDDGRFRPRRRPRQCFVFLNGLAMNRPEVMIPQAQNKFDAESELNDPATHDFIVAHLAAFQAWVLQMR